MTVHEAGEVFAVAAHGDYRVITLVAPGVAASFEPGQVLTVAVPGAMLRRPVQVQAATPTGQFAGTVQIVVDSHDGDFQWIVERQPGQTLDLLGPVGRPFPLPSAPVPAVLVGVGASAGALIPLGAALTAAGCELEFLIGAPTAGRLFGELAAKRAAGRVEVATTDGSAGERGSVVDLLWSAIARSGAQVVYAAGPVPVLARIAQVAQEHAIPAQVALDQRFSCGTGICAGCAVPVRGDDGADRMLRVCVEGPVLPGGRVRFEELVS